jgi:hypothetical protein
MLTYAVGVKYRHQAQLQDHLAVEEALARRACVVLYLLALLVLYWYKSAQTCQNTWARLRGALFTCFTGALLVQKCKC